MSTLSLCVPCCPPSPLKPLSSHNAHCPPPYPPPPPPVPPQHLPVFQFDKDDFAGDAQLINSVYFDNENLELYHGRLDKKPNAIAVRIRWVWQGGVEGGWTGCYVGAGGGGSKAALWLPVCIKLKAYLGLQARFWCNRQAASLPTL